MKTASNNPVIETKTNKEMVFAFSNKRLYVNLLFGVLYVGLGFSFFFEQDPKWTYKPYFLLAVGLLYTMMFLFEYKQKYFKITNDKIKINSIPSEEIDLRELTEVKYFADDYTFNTTNKTVKIVKSQINKKQLPEFESFFDDLKNNLSKNPA